MTVDAQRSRGTRRASGEIAPDRSRLLVPPAMFVVALALGVAGHLHLGLTPEVATAAGVSLFCLMLMSHILLKAADEADIADEEAAERSAAQVTSPMPTVPLPREDSLDAPNLHAAETPAKPEVGTIAPSGPQPAGEPAPNEVDPAWSFRPVDLRQGDGGFGAPGSSAPVLDSSHAGGPAASAELPSVESGVASLGSLRPTFEAHTLPLDGAGAGEHLSVDREADRIDAILKRLAKQIHDGAAERSGASVPELTGSEPALPAGQVATNAPAAPSLEEMAVADPDNALASAVDALRSTVEAMRGAGAPAVEEAPLSAAEISIAAVADAIQAESADVFLSPILGLADQSARHFEVSVKLRAEVPDDRAVAAGAGLLPLLDALNVRHAAGFALMLQRRGRDGAVFSRVGGGSLESERFVSDVAGRHAQGIADRMVLSFAQEEMRGLGPAQLTALEDLARLGFRFALQGVADLDMDFEALRATGFDFVKLDAGVFQAGLVCSGEVVPANEICDHFEDLGLSVIVGDIADADMRDRLVSWGVAYGQGSLFGEPRPVPLAMPATGTMAA